ncbi:hypothetical protein PV379_22435 [Streptomyces caniscabiei]|uniref:hypothetical protein n=1 Tax=Streptomyces caniscabiei TaxID=2746961 RepID=UPI0029A31E38|nr:hypothetical protein [Streptomyces caniscabiei]MDX2780054.1 hypothetical protein [Streptomyces caniscabiei]
MAKTTQAQAMIIAAVIGAVALIIGALIALLGGGGDQTNSCRSDTGTVQNCGNDNDFKMNTAETPSPSPTPTPSETVTSGGSR